MTKRSPGRPKKQPPWRVAVRISSPPHDAGLENVTDEVRDQLIGWLRERSVTTPSRSFEILHARHLAGQLLSPPPVEMSETLKIALSAAADALARDDAVAVAYHLKAAFTEREADLINGLSEYAMHGYTKLEADRKRGRRAR
jgi:hypothetical protein